jgi:hypothetical protein
MMSSSAMAALAADPAVARLGSFRRSLDRAEIGGMTVHALADRVFGKGTTEVAIGTWGFAGMLRCAVPLWTCRVLRDPEFASLTLSVAGHERSALMVGTKGVADHGCEALILDVSRGLQAAVNALETMYDVGIGPVYQGLLRPG